MTPKLSLMAQCGVRDGRRLHLLAKMESLYHKLEEATERRVRRQTFLRHIREYAEGGQVAVVWSGRDCDGVRYTGYVRLVEATVQAVAEHIAHTYEWADGPCACYIERPSVGRFIESHSRDLVMEAFEDGHPHVIYD